MFQVKNTNTNINRNISAGASSANSNLQTTTTSNGSIGNGSIDTLQPKIITTIKYVFHISRYNLQLLFPIFLRHCKVVIFRFIC
jgi:hypothetical protein